MSVSYDRAPPHASSLSPLTPAFGRGDLKGENKRVESKEEENEELIAEKGMK